MVEEEQQIPNIEVSVTNFQNLDETEQLEKDTFYEKFTTDDMGVISQGTVHQPEKRDRR